MKFVQQLKFVLNKILMISMMFFVAKATLAGPSPLIYEANIDAGIRETGPMTELMIASANGNVNKIRKLLEGGVNVNEITNGGEDSLMFAAKSGKVEAVRTLLKSNALPNQITHDGHNTALIFASCYSTGEVVKLLLKHGADPNIISNPRIPLGNPPALDTSILCGKFNNSVILIENGAKMRDALWSAILMKKLDWVKFLVKRGASVRRNIPDLQMAKEHSTPEISEYLKLKSYKSLDETDKIYPDSLDELARMGGVVRELYENPKLKLSEKGDEFYYSLSCCYTTLERKIIKNAIFARYGFPFKSAWLRNYFSNNFESYAPNNNPLLLTSIDRENLLYLKRIQK